MYLTSPYAENILDYRVIDESYFDSRDEERI